MRVEATISGATVFTEEYLQNSHEVLAVLRDEGPVHRATTVNGLSVWVVSRYEDVKAALADNRLHKSPEGMTAAIRANLEDPDRRLVFSTDLAHHMLNSDGNDHTRLRKLVAKAFSPRAGSS